MNNEIFEFCREQEKTPDLFYYQLNGKSAIENYKEQKNNFLEYLDDSKEDEGMYITFESKVNN